MPISFDKEKFKSGVSSVRSKSGSAKGKMDGFRAKWNGDKSSSSAGSTEPAPDIVSRPLKSLPDPKTFAPPPKHREWYGDEVAQQSLAVARDAQYVQQPARAPVAAPAAAQPPAPVAYQPAAAAQPPAPVAYQPAAQPGYQAAPAPPPRGPAAGGPPPPPRPVPAAPAAAAYQPAPAAAPAAYQPVAYQPAAATPAPPPRDQPPSYDNLAPPQTPSRPPPTPARPGVPTQPYANTPPASDPNVYGAPAATPPPAAASTPAGINFAAQIANRRGSAASSVSDITQGMAQTAIGKKKPPPPLPKKKPGLAGKPVPGAKPFAAPVAAVAALPTPSQHTVSAVEAALGAQTYSKAAAFVPPPSGKAVDTQLHTQWFVNDSPPPDLQGLGWTSQFSSSAGTTTKIYAFRIPEDLSIIKLRIVYPTHNPAAATCERKDVPPPRELSPGELYEYNLQYGDAVARWAESMVGTQVGDGECWTLAKNAIEQSSQTALVSQAYTHGALIYQQNGPPSNPANVVKNVEAIRRGDILQFFEAKFESRSAGGFSSSSYGVPNHTAVVVGVSEGQKTIYILHQNTGGSKIVQAGQIELAEMTSGELKAFRVVGAEWAGQLDCSM